MTTIRSGNLPAGKIQGALDALVVLADANLSSLSEKREAYWVIKRALEAAAQQEADWEAIEAWQERYQLSKIGVYVDDCGVWIANAVDAHGALLGFESVWDEGNTRASVTHEAAEWCRKELAK